MGKKICFLGVLAVTLLILPIHAQTVAKRMKATAERFVVDKPLEQEKLKAARIAKAKDSLEYSMARAQLEKQYLIAPFDGEIVAISKNPSESVEALEPIIEIADVRTCRMTAYIIVSKASSLKVGQEVSMQLNSGKIRNKKGKIEFISPVVDKASLLRTVKVVFENSDKSVEPGVTGKIFVK